jgi:hypothetical protein
MRNLLSISFILLGFIISLFFSCDLFDKKDPAPFSMQLYPETTEVIVEQRCVFLIKVEDEEDGKGEGEKVKIAAKADDVELSISPSNLTPGKVAEITVIPGASIIKTSVPIEITGKREGLIETLNASITVVHGEDLIHNSAEEIRDRFIPWLAENHPEFGITNETNWAGTIVTPNILIVANYLFFSNEWEMGLTYHVMIPPHDWARIYFRKRFEEMQPSFAFEITSLDTNEPPMSITPPENVYR